MFWTEKINFWSIVQDLEQSKGKKACFGTHSLMITAHMQTTENNYSWLATTQNGHIFFETHLNNTNMITLFFLCKYGHMYVCNNNPLVFIVYYPLMVSWFKQHWGKLFFEVTFFTILVMFIYSEKATKFCKISTVDLSYVSPVKSMVEISQNFCGLLRIYEL